MSHHEQQLRAAVVGFCVVLLGALIPLRASAQSELAYPQTDVGIFSDLSPKTRSLVPQWLSNQAAECKTREHIALLTLGGHPVKAYPLVDGALRPEDLTELKKMQATPCEPLKTGLPDRDADGIPDSLDVSYGARKTAINAASYGGPYQVIDYPGGDIERSRGVCTDVIVRALRNAGYDLQKDLIEDMERAPRAYGLKGRRPNRSIEHRRVRRQIVYFRRKFRALPVTFQKQASGRAAWLPGDIVFMDTLPKRGPDHVGVVSDRVDDAGRPMIINNWDNGYRTSDMSLLGSVPITHRFRITERRPR